MKPGQLMTRNNHIFRVIKAKDPKYPCEECTIRYANIMCCISVCERFKVPQNCYLKIVK